MTTAKHLGPISLGVCVLGMIVMETLIHLGVCANPWWRVLAMGFEAGTIGGMADWFAVSALFRTVPIPLLSRHTNIIARNRTRIVDNLKDYVQNRLLTSAVIQEKLSGVRFVVLGLQHLDRGDSRQRLQHSVRTVLAAGIADLDRERLATFIETTAVEHLLRLETARPLGAWLRQGIEHGDHAALWESIIAQSQTFVAHASFRQRLLDIIKLAAAKERSAGFMQKLFLSTAEAAGGFKYDSWAGQIAAALGDWLEDLKHNPTHDFRQEADRHLLTYASALEGGEAEAVAMVARCQQALVQRLDLKPLLTTALDDLASRLQRDLQDADSELSQAVAGLVDGAIERLRTDAGLQEVVDQQVRTVVVGLIEANHALIGDMVGSSLSPEKISDQALAAQIEDRIGSDLQYIRLNGAIVGGVVGALIMTAKFCLLGF